MITKVYCMFEQSGVFKNAFINLGISAVDIDIRNDFKQTDIQIDIFKEIEKGFNDEVSIFDNIKDTDLIFAFFPCIRFAEEFYLLSRCERHKENWNNLKSLEYTMKINNENKELYNLFCKLFFIAEKRGLKLIVENPYSQPNYLTSCFPIKPTLIDKDRTLRGDYYRKPTQYFFVNLSPAYNIFFEAYKQPKNPYVVRRGKLLNGCNRSVNRSLICSDYAERFIKEFILSSNELK